MNAEDSRKRRRASGSTFAMPVAIAFISLVGLIAALVGDGIFNMLSWIALAAVNGVIAWALLARRK